VGGKLSDRHELLDRPQEVQLHWTRGRQYEKNWIPIADRAVACPAGYVWVAYSLCPHVILLCSLTSGRCEEAYRTKLPGCKLLTGLSLTSTLVYSAASDSLVGVCHRKSNRPEMNQGLEYEHFYYHIEPRPPFAILSISAPFQLPPFFSQATIARELENDGSQLDDIQYVSGAVLGNGGAELVLTYGIADCTALIARLALRTVIESLSLQTALLHLNSSDQTRASSLDAIGSEDEHREVVPAAPPGVALFSRTM